jgi:transcriptional regulator with XRE-family HTH domain
MTTSDILTQIRTTKGMSRQELADLLNVRKSYIANIESGNYPFSLAKLIEIADLLGYDIEIAAKPKSTNGRTA